MFSKKDLRNGDKLTLRNGETDYYSKDMCRSFGGLWNDDINEDLTNEVGKDLNIVKVERAAEYETIYTREEKREMTIAEIEKILGYNVKIIKE